MIERYEIKRINKEERLILYLNFSVEFAKLGSKNKKKKLDDIIKEYMIRNNIEFKGKVISIIIGGVFVGNIILNNSFYNIKSNKDVHFVSNEIVEMLNKDVPVSINVQDIEQKQDTKIVTTIQNTKESEKVINNNQVVNNNTKKNNNVSSDVTNNEINNNNMVSNNNQEEVNVVSNTDTTNEENIDNNTNVNVQEEIKEEVVDNNIYISLIRNGNYEKIELEEYIVGVVGAEMPASFSIEALKAQAVIARTYALKAYSQGRSLNANESNQSYKTIYELQSMWGGNFNTYYNKIVSAVNGTKGVYLSYNGNYIEAVYHSTSNGKTESSANVWGNYYPYLVSVASPYDNNNPSFIGSKSFSYGELSNILGMDINNESIIEVTGRTSGDRVASINIGDRSYRGVDLRNILGLRSSDFDITFSANGITFTTRGYGHGVGLSQYGANGYAKNGYSFQNILYHYYPGVSINSL